MKISFPSWINVNNPKKLEVFFSDDAYKEMLLETKERIFTETGGLFLGQIIDNTWIIFEVVDPGPKAYFSNSLFEYDHEYQEHLANKIARRYESLELLGLWHRHPGTFNDFSSTDFDTFKKFIANENRGILSGLVNLIPEFQFTLYYIEENVKNYCKMEYQIKDVDFLRKNFGIKQKTIDEIKNKFLHTDKPKFNEKNSICNIPVVSIQPHDTNENELCNTLDAELPFLRTQKKEPTVLLPIEYIEKKYCGDLYGFYFPSTNNFNILDKNILNSQFLGEITENKIEKNESILQGYYENNNLILKTNMGEQCVLKPYSLIMDIFSRNAGIIESNKLLNKKVLILGCGSVGSHVAIELAKLGVGNFVLIDNDILSYGNICRHQCGITEVGMYKVDAVTNKIMAINPTVNIETFQTILQNLSKEDFEVINKQKIDLIVGTADNREADLYANKISQLLDIPFVSVGFWERAFAGEIFFSIPGESPCYYCVFGEYSQSFDYRVSENRQVYSFESDISKINFEPGISLDINYITNVGLKVILDLLNKDDEKYRYKVLNYLTNYTLVCNNNDEQLDGDQAKLFTHPLQITSSIGIKKMDGCPHCKLKGGFYK